MTTANLQLRSQLRQLFSDWSDRTFATYWKAFNQLTAVQNCGYRQDAHEAAIRLSSRPNGSVNVTRYAQLADDWAAMAVVTLAPDDTAGGPHD